MERAACRAANLGSDSAADLKARPAAECAVGMDDEGIWRLPKRFRFLDDHACVEDGQRRWNEGAVRAARQQANLRSVTVCVWRKGQRRALQVARHRSSAIEKAIELGRSGGDRERSRGERDADTCGGGHGDHRDGDHQFDQREPAIARRARFPHNRSGASPSGVSFRRIRVSRRGGLIASH